jgi:uncharacterized protein
MSKLTSPIQFSASLQPGASGRVLIELLGEDGRVLYRKLIRYTTQDWVAISDNIEFDISAVAEASRLQISTEDEYSRIMALASVDVVLLSMGQDDLNPPSDLLESLIIREPGRKSGGHRAGAYQWGTAFISRVGECGRHGGGLPSSCGHPACRPMGHTGVWNFPG